MKLVRIFTLILACSTQAAFAFTQTELDTLKVAAQAEPSIQGCLTGGDDVCVADWFNAASSYIVWKSRVTKDTYQTETGPTTGTTFNWSGTGGYIARSQGERDAWNTLFSATNYVNPSRANVIAAFNDIFSGTGAGAVANRALLLDLSKRAATNAEKVLATGTGTNATPGTMTWEGRISPNDIYLIKWH